MKNDDKMSLDDLVWSKTMWEMGKLGAVWGIPYACIVMQKNERGFSLIQVMPFTSELQFAGNVGFDVPKSPAQLLKHQRQQFDFIAKRFRAAGLDFDDPKNLLERKKKNENEGTN